MLIRIMTIEDYDKVYGLWLSCKGMGLNDVDDSREGIERYLKRNPDTCFVAEEEGEILGVDSGSTAILFAQALKERFRKLTVVTHSRDVFELLCDYEAFTVILCGGHYLGQERAFYGPLALETLGKLRVQKGFLFPSAVSLEAGICDYQQELLTVQKALLEASEQVFVLADSSKFEKKALLRLSDMERNYTYITDGGLPEEIRRLYTENGIRIHTGGTV